MAAGLTVVLAAGSAPALQPQNDPAQPAAAPAPQAAPAKPIRNADRRRAARLFLDASKLYEKGSFEEALGEYEEAARLDPENREYPLAAGVARSHAVMALVQQAAKARLKGDTATARAALVHGMELDPANPLVGQHLNEMADDVVAGQVRPLYEQKASTAGEAPVLAPRAGPQSFHVRNGQRQTIQQVFKAYGIEATVDDSVRSVPIRFDMDDVEFDAATRALSMATGSFYVPIDAHRALVARDTRELRQQFQRLELETIYLPGLSATEMTDVTNLARNVFEIQQASAEAGAGTITVRAPPRTLDAFNATLRQLLDGRSQVMLEVRLIQLAHTSERNIGVQPPQTISAFNLYTEEQKILNDNKDLVQQIINSGLASPGDTLTILAILLASGQVSSSLLSNGFAIFGGGITLSALSPGPAKANFALNSSDSRELDLIQLRLGDGEQGTLRQGARYPIQTSSFSSLAGNVPSIPGLNTPGNSTGLAGVVNPYSTSIPNIPQVEYQDLGLTLKATPKVMRDDLVALTLDMKIDALSGGTINGNPILNNRAYSGVVTLKPGEAVVVVSELDKSQSRAISGTPGMSEIPGLNDISSNDRQKNFASLLIVMTPHVVRGLQAAGHSAMMRVERNVQTR
ncbi:MAG: hypothetical protein WCE75_13980 [Terracidiphilus sp.]